MFMVASSCITTIMILNYHHRLADTHEMPEWVQSAFLQWIPWVAENVQTWGEDNKEDTHDGSEDEGLGYEGDIFKVTADKCAGYGR